MKTNLKEKFNNFMDKHSKEVAYASVIASTTVTYIMGLKVGQKLGYSNGCKDTLLKVMTDKLNK